jgi:hypothetical protein
MEKKIDENLLKLKFKNKQEFARKWREFNSIDVEAGWRELQKRVPALRRLSFDGTFVEPPTSAKRRLLEWLREPRNRVAAGLILVSSLIGIYVLRSRLWPREKGHVPDLGYQKTFLERGEGQAALLLAGQPAGSVINEGRVTIQLEPGELLLRSRNVSPDPPDSLLTLHTARGGRCSMIMTDGSKVHLNAASYIQFATYYGKQQREVNLNGEGYFEVKPLAAQSGKRRKSPFVVHVGTKLTVRATGTVFNIRAYDSDSSIRATLVSGTLEVQRPGDTNSRTLASGDSYILNKDGSFEVQPADPLDASPVDDAVGWTEGRFTFSDRPLDEILQELCRVYDVKVEYKCSPVGPFNLTAFRDEPIKKVLPRIDGDNNIHIYYQDQDSTIIVSMSSPE